MTWFVAKDHCEREGGKLVEIDSEEENTALVEEINKRKYKKMHFWIGLTSRGKKDDWRLASNGSKPSFENWHKDEPDNRNEENCARLRIGPISSWKDTWSDISCKQETIKYDNHPEFSLHALCEFDPVTENPSTTTATATATTTENASIAGVSKNGNQLLPQAHNLLCHVQEVHLIMSVLISVLGKPSIVKKKIFCETTS